MKSLREIYERYDTDHALQHTRADMMVPLVPNLPTQVKHNPGSDKGTTHSYIEFYEELLAPYRHTARHVLEIGIMAGSSLRMWEEYFTAASVHGIDATGHPMGYFVLAPMMQEGTHHISIMDATSPTEVETEFKDVLFDVIIEDAQHTLTQQLAIYDAFRSHLAPGGIYIIEDVENIDRDRLILEVIDPDRRVEVVDRRPAKNRFDDVLVIIRN